PGNLDHAMEITAIGQVVAFAITTDAVATGKAATEFRQGYQFTPRPGHRACNLLGPGRNPVEGVLEAKMRICVARQLEGCNRQIDVRAPRQQLHELAVTGKVRI